MDGSAVLPPAERGEIAPFCTPMTIPRDLFSFCPSHLCQDVTFSLIRVMRKMSSPWSLRVFALLITLGLNSCTATPPPLTAWPSEKVANRTPLEAKVKARFWRVDGDRIVNGAGKPVTLRGIAFGNEVWNHVALPTSHHTARDFRQVADMGMNSVRFYLSYRSFEDDDAAGRYKESGWDWLDQNIEWAQAHGIRLILNMHDPYGGYQSQGEGVQLWQDEVAQKRFIDLWRAIAERYRAEPTIAGFDILNEPAPTVSIEQWKELAERTISEIREVNQEHMVFVERVNSVGGDWSENENRNFFRVRDSNVVYEFHFYKPYHFTHQNAAWSDLAAREGWYPDANVPEVEWYELKVEQTRESEPLPPGDSDWMMIETEPFLVNDEKLVIGKPFLVCDAGQGSVIFDSLSLIRTLPVLAEQGEQSTDGDAAAALPETEILFEQDLDTRRGWYFWNKNGQGHAEFVPEGHGDHTALSIMGTTGPANLGSDPLRFLVEQGSEYQLSALVQAQGLAEASRCKIRLEFYSSKVPVQARSKAYLRQELEAYLAWGSKEQVPLYLGEFGTIRDSFLPGRGGEKWVSDMLALIKERNVHFAYHAYHESAFGLYRGDRSLPQARELNTELENAFKNSLLKKSDVKEVKSEESSLQVDVKPENGSSESESGSEGERDSESTEGAQEQKVLEF